MNDKKLDALFSGLTGKTGSEQTKEQKGKEAEQTAIKQPNSDRQTRFCTILSNDLQRKIRIIASKESVQIKDVVEAALQKAIDSYERKHGKVDGDIKGNAKNLF